MDWKALNNIIDKSDNIILSTHVNPDGDGLGSQLGLYYYLKSLNKNCSIINTSPIPEHYSFLDSECIFQEYSRDKHSDLFNNCDILIALDIGDYNRMNDIVKEITNRNIYSISIDHHPEKTKFFDLSLVDIKAPATGFLVWDYLMYNNYTKLPLNAANGLYCALITDTGSFKYNSTTSECHNMAAHLLERGVKPYDIYDLVYERREISQVKLLSYVINNLEFYSNDEFAGYTITKEVIDSHGAKYSDVEGFTDFVRSIKGVQVSFMILEQPHNIRINFRSRGKYIINDIAEHFGGGGHKLAAGATVENQSIEEIKSKIINLLIRKK